MSGWKLTKSLTNKIYHYARFPATGVSLRQMVQFGGRPSQGTLFRASQFVAEELPIRLAHRVKDLESLPHGLSNMPSIQRVRDWYAQSFQELTELPAPKLDADLKQKLFRPHVLHAAAPSPPSEEIDNHLDHNHHHHHPHARDVAIKPEGPHDAKRAISNRRYFANVEPDTLWPPEIYAYNQDLTTALKKIKRRHDPVVTTVAQGVQEWKDTVAASSRLDAHLAESLVSAAGEYRATPYGDALHHHTLSSPVMDQSVQAFLDRFYMSRIGIRMLIGQHIALNEEPVRDDYVGIIGTAVHVRDMAQAAADNARFICEEWYGLYEAPPVEIVCRPELRFMYVPGHLNHMLFETIKNSLRAVVEKHGIDADFPAVKIIVAEGNEDITIKISDEGGGIPRSEVPYVWTYMYTTVEETPSLEPDFNKSDFKAPMAGFGYGLPISRLYARYFGGDLKLISMEGYGTDVYLHLNRLSSSSEPLG
ncbi:uncharacterized protein SAPINGB_P006226 [Magnusiomyces paraingens]|uniref:Protein-serine/threonine kinase n=1 Tax=Magnusiomyces paraingens TaxID=2606893 RepID=A0A5E8C3W9_9ASCO|nr:uncharacterized protein SAPINGB_P006226 [Saprochaete ingens]VVT58474.1 unnamed protein product [Saprochaete ingens]